MYHILSSIAILLILSISALNGEIIEDYEEESTTPHIHAKFAYVTWTKEKGYELKIFGSNLDDSLDVSDTINWIAKGRYQNLVNKTGWAYVEVETKPTWPDEMQGYAAGMAEGYLTKDLIAYFWKNTIEKFCDGQEKLCTYLRKYVRQNALWTYNTAFKQKNNSPYWYQANLFVKQFFGLVAGYRKAAKKPSDIQISVSDFLFMNMLGDLDDLKVALDPNPPNGTRFQEGHCSALIKLIGQKDIYASHVTWTVYESMLRIIKRYNFGYKTSSAAGSPTVPGYSISFSSYPAMLHSMDDYYLSSSGLLVTETSIGNYNESLWKQLKTTDSLLVGMRVMIATRLATDGRTWTKLFSRYNSGTYNNQWMVLNYNAFEPDQPTLREGVLWVLEQMPGMIVAKDVTDVLQKNGYWASYNTPYFSEVFQISGYGQMVEKYGDWFSFENTPRAKIFARDQGNVEDLESMVKLMRYNDYQNDEFSKCNCTPPYSAENAISSRCDLNPANGTYPFFNLGHRPSGATDMKVTSLDLFLLQEFEAISGPTFDPLPPFQWSTSDYNDRPHYGHPDRFEFEPRIHHWKWL